VVHVEGRMTAVEPLAYLARMRNTRRGISSRTKLIRQMRRGERSVSDLGRMSGLSESTVRYHLKNMSKERLVARSAKKRGGMWRLTGAGQRTIEEATQ